MLKNFKETVTLVTVSALLPLYMRSLTERIPMTYSIPFSFVPGTKAKAQEVNANFNAVSEQLEDLDGLKLNRDCSNVTNATKSFVAAMASPSATVINLTLASSGTVYTAPANGWVYCTISATDASGITFISSYNLTKSYGIRDNVYRNSNSTTLGQSVFLPLSEGDKFNITYSMGNNLSSIDFKFLYAKGSESEAA